MGVCLLREARSNRSRPGRGCDVPRWWLAEGPTRATDDRLVRRGAGLVITLAADYCSQCTDAELCALIEHELYHIAQKLDQYGAPKFTQDGLPSLTIRSHDVEEFVGVVRRYGASEDVQQLIDAASRPPEVAKINISRACGTCLLKSA